MAHKKPYEKIKEYMQNEGNGCILITTEEEYLNGVAKQKLKIQCICGNVFEVKLSNFRNSQKQCPNCSAKQVGIKHRLTIDDLKTYIKELDNGTTLISTEYEKGNKKLFFKCGCGKIFSCCWGNFTKQQNKCTECLKEPYKWTIDKINEYLNTEEGNNCKLLSEKYINSYSSKLKFKCSCGNTFYRTLGSFLVGQKQCDECAMKSRTAKTKKDINYIREYVKEYGCTLLSNYYENNKTKLTLQCKCGKIFTTFWNLIQLGKHQCNDCGIKLKSGENNVLWKGGITPINRQIRSSKEYKGWRMSVFERDNYTCQCCGDNKGGNLNAHHIENFSDNEELRFDINNGITLCDKCHNPNQIGSFHHTYGTHDNTKDQLEEYIKHHKNKNN